MGTSTASSDLHSDKLAKLQARKKELEILLAAKNEDLYKLCVQEVKLTGVMPPEAPHDAPDASAEGESSRGDRRDSEGGHRKDSVDSSHSRKSRHSHRQDKTKEPDVATRKHTSHRLSTPSVSGVSVNPPRKDYTSANYASLAHDSRDTFSLHSSQTYPTLQLSPERLPHREQRRPHASADTLPAIYSRHHITTTEHVDRLYYNSRQPETQSFSRVHETHFSSSHPDITTQYSHTLASTSQVPGPGPLLYQYASQLRARSQHLGPVVPAGRRRDARRHTLQRTQTYHLTAPSDYPPEALLSRHSRAEQTHQPSQPPQPAQAHRHPLTLSSQSISSQLLALNNNSTHSLYSNQFGDNQDQKIKEKEWYESSLDSPSGVGLNLSRESVKFSPKKTLQRTSSVSHSHGTVVDESLASPNDYTPMVLSPSSSHISQSTVSHPGPHNFQSPHTTGRVPFESPKNLTVVESGKWIPYREVTKPFEMSDFYKYSTKFRQSHNNAIPKPQMSKPVVPDSPGGSSLS